MINKIFDIKGIYLVRPTYTDNIELFVKGDYNDADYSTNTEFISIEEFELLLPIIKKVLSYKGYCNWNDNEKYLTDEEIRILSDYVPSGDDRKCHTIEEIKVWYLCSDAIRYEIQII